MPREQYRKSKKGGVRWHVAVGVRSRHVQRAHQRCLICSDQCNSTDPTVDHQSPALHRTQLESKNYFRVRIRNDWRDKFSGVFWTRRHGATENAGVENADQIAGGCRSRQVAIPLLSTPVFSTPAFSAPPAALTWRFAAVLAGRCLYTPALWSCDFEFSVSYQLFMNVGFHIGYR